MRISYHMCLISCMAPLTNLNEPSEGEEHLEMKGGCLSKAITLSTCLWIVWWRFADRQRQKVRLFGLGRFILKNFPSELMVSVVAISLDTTCWPHHGSWNFQVTGDMSFCQRPMRKSGKPGKAAALFMSLAMLFHIVMLVFLKPKLTEESLLGNWEVETLKASNIFCKGSKFGLGTLEVWWGMIPPNAGGKKCFYHEHCGSCLGAASNQLCRFQDFESSTPADSFKSYRWWDDTSYCILISNVYVDHGTGYASSGSFLPGIWRKENVYAPEPVGWNSCGDLMSYSVALIIDMVWYVLIMCLIYSHVSTIVHGFITRVNQLQKFLSSMPFESIDVQQQLPPIRVHDCIGGWQGSNSSKSGHFPQQSRLWRKIAHRHTH